MEYRMKYRDVPWCVALGVPLGKMIGCWFINPWKKIQRNWKRIAMRWLKRLLFTVVVLLILAMLCILIDKATEGAYFNWLLGVFNNIRELKD